MPTKNLTWCSLVKKAGRLSTRTDLGKQIEMVLEEAKKNADQTVFKERAAPLADWNRIAIDSIGVLMCDNSLPYINDRTEAWFKGAGVTW